MTRGVGGRSDRDILSRVMRFLVLALVSHLPSGARTSFSGSILCCFGIFDVGEYAGAITSNANPPEHEVLSIEALSGRVEKYTAERNWDYLRESGSKSFLYRAWVHRYVSAEQYYWGIVVLLVFGSGLLFVGLVRESLLEKKRL